MIFKTPSKFTALALFSAVILTALPVAAVEEGWITFKSNTGLFSVLFPEKNLKEEMVGFRLNDEAVAHYGTVSSVIDQRPFKNETKTHTISVRQTLGEPLTNKERGKIIQDEIEIIAAHYKPMKGEVISINEDVWQTGYPGGEVFIKYQDPNFGKQYVKARIFVTDVSKIYQILNASESVMNAFKSRDFFSTMIVNDGYSLIPGKISEDWPVVTSPFNMFTINVPDVVQPYVPDPVKIEFKDKIERVFTRFYDPIWDQNIIYNVYGYALDRDLSYENVVELITERHIKKHRFSAEGVEVRRLRDGPRVLRIVDTQYKMNAPPDYPYIKNVKLRAHFYKNYVMVSEVMASDRLIGAPLVDLILRQGVFHPQIVQMPKEASGTVAAPDTAAKKAEAAAAAQTKVEEQTKALEAEEKAAEAEPLPKMKTLPPPNPR